MKGKTKAMILTAIIAVISLFTFLGCRSDETIPVCVFPETSEPLKDGAYFMTDYGYSVLKSKYAKYEFPQVKLNALIKDNKISVDHIFVTNRNDDVIMDTEWVSCNTLAYDICEKDGKYFGADKYGNLEVKIALNGNRLYIDDEENVYQLELNGEYSLSDENAEYEDPKDLSVGCRDSIYVSWSPYHYVGFGAYAELVSADDGRLMIRRVDFPYMNKFSFTFGIDKYPPGKYVLKVCYLGGPMLRRADKEVFILNDSPGLEFEVNITDEGATMYPGYFFPKISYKPNNGVYFLTDNGYEMCIRNGYDLASRENMYAVIKDDTILMGDTQQLYSYYYLYNRDIIACYIDELNENPDIYLACLEKLIYVKYSDIVLEFRCDDSYTEIEEDYIELADPDIMQFVNNSSNDPIIRLGRNGWTSQKCCGIKCFLRNSAVSQDAISKYIRMNDGIIELHVNEFDLLPGDNIIEILQEKLLILDNENKTFYFIRYPKKICLNVVVADDIITIEKKERH